MLPALFDVTQVDVERGRALLRASGKVLKSPGFLAVYQEVVDKLEAAEEEGSATLPPLAEGELLRLIALEQEQKFTQPPAQFSEATLVKALEESGIGRPSTYAAILSTLSEREYAEKLEGRFRPTPLGKVVNKLLQSGFGDIINEGYTARLEEELDEIEEGKLPWKDAIIEFDRKFDKDLARGDKKWPDIKGMGIAIGELYPARAAERCPKCGRELVVRFDVTAPSSAAAATASRRATTPTTRAESRGHRDDENAEIAPCELCGKPMALRRARDLPRLHRLPRMQGIGAGSSGGAPKETGVGCPGKEGTIQDTRAAANCSPARYPKRKFALEQADRVPVPECGNPLLTEKTTKRKGTVWLCPKEGCGYEVEAPESAAG
jgi:DNA topoisomerase-1